AAVLDCLAEHGIVHGSLKAGNVFVSGENAQIRVRLLDHGACALADVARVRPLLAPEQITTGHGEVGPHTDVFALSCLVYEALSGHPPFSTGSAAVAAYEVLNHHPAPVRAVASELPEAVDWVLTVGLAKRAADRYRRASDLARDLKAAFREPHLD